MPHSRFVSVPRTCAWQPYQRGTVGPCRRDHSVVFTIPYHWHPACNDSSGMRDLLMAIIAGELAGMSGCDSSESRRLRALYDALEYRRTVDLAYNPTFWRIAVVALGPDITARMAQVVQVLH